MARCVRVAIVDSEGNPKREFVQVWCSKYNKRRLTNLRYQDVGVAVFHMEYTQPDSSLISYVYTLYGGGAGCLYFNRYNVVFRAFY